MQLRAPARPSLDGERFDVVVIGGGVNGVAIARECARGGKRTLIVEQNDFSCGTTSRSTRIIHGGLRYLEHGEIGLVRESLRERERLLRERPHLVRPLKFILAVHPTYRRNALTIRAGLWLYRVMAGAKNRQFDGAEGRREFERLLDAGQTWTVFDYDDAQCEFPERLVAEWLSEAAEAGAAIRNHTEALEVAITDGCVSGVIARDRLSGQEWRVQADRVINATGPWADSILQRSGVTTANPLIGGVRGSHVVLPQFSGGPRAAIYAEATDGRPIFFIPWNDQLLVGTTEVQDNGDPSNAQPAASEIEYLINSANRIFPALGATADDVRYAFSGVRPLPFVTATSPSAITRRHILFDHADTGAAGMISVIGGKLTTAASLARECAHKIGVKIVQDEAPVFVAAPPEDGITSTLEQWSRQVAIQSAISQQSVYAIAQWHGRRALHVVRFAERDARMRQPLCDHSQHLVAEAVAAVEHEFASTLGDILLRRVPVAFNACWSEECSRTASERVGAALGWNEARIAAEFQAFEEERRRFLIKPARMPSAISARANAERST